jgi:peptide/nickel transport system substrate-binding protein
MSVQVFALRTSFDSRRDMRESDVPAGMNVLHGIDPRTGLLRRQFLARGLGSVATMGALGTLLQACGDGSESTGAGEVVGKPPARPTGTLTTAIAAAPTSLDPGRRLGASFFPTEDLYDSLVAYNAAFTKVVPELCESWRVSPDGREWSGKLRAGATFHDGTPIDSTAIKRNFEYFLKNPEYLFIPLPIKEMDDSRPDVIRFIFESPYPYFTNNVTLLKMQSAKAIEAGPKAIDKHPIGSGPFQFESQDATTVTLKRYPDYWHKGRPYLERLKFVVIGDAAARLNALRSGQVNLTMNLAPNEAALLEKDQRVKVLRRPGWFMALLEFKLMHPAVRDVRVRQAIAYAVDRETILKTLGHGQGEVAKGWMMPGIEGYSEMSPSYAYDPDKARALLAQVGKPVTLRLGVDAGDGGGNILLTEAVAQAIAAQLKEVGIDISVDALQGPEAQKERAELKPRHALYLGGILWFTGGPTAYSFLESQHNMEQAYPKEFARYKQLWDKVNAELDVAERERMIAEIQQINARVLTAVPLWYMPQVDGVSRNLQGYLPNVRNFGPDLVNAYYAS